MLLDEPFPLLFFVFFNSAGNNRNCEEIQYHPYLKINLSNQSAAIILGMHRIFRQENLDLRHVLSQNLAF